MNEEESKDVKIVKFEVAGENPILWEKLRGKLVDVINNFLDTFIDQEKGLTIREEAKKLTSLALNFAEEKLKKPGIENHKMLAEVEEKYSAIEKNKAEARKINAEAKKIEFYTTVEKMRLSLKLSRALISGKSGEEFVVFTKQIDAFLEAVEEYSNANNLIQ